MHIAIIQVGRQGQILAAALTLDFFLLPIDITLILGGDFHLLTHLLVELGALRQGCARQAQQRFIADVGPPQQLDVASAADTLQTPVSGSTR